MDEFIEYLYVTGQLDDFFDDKRDTDDDVNTDEDTQDNNDVKVRKRI